MLLIQGVGVAGSGWRPQIQALSREFDVVSFDNRGVGASARGDSTLSVEGMAEDVRALLDRLGWESAHVIGHSLGGLIAQQLALSHPARVRSLSLLCTFSQGKEATRLTPMILWLGLRTRIGTRRMRRNAMLRMILSREAYENRDLGRIATEYGELMGRDLGDSPAILQEQLKAMGKHDAFDALSSLAKIPTLVLSASEDPIAPPDLGRKLAAAIPGARFVEIASASHAVTLEKPDEINGILLAFLKSFR